MRLMSKALLAIVMTLAPAALALSPQPFDKCQPLTCSYTWYSDASKTTVVGYYSQSCPDPCTCQQTQVDWGEHTAYMTSSCEPCPSGCGNCAPNACARNATTLQNPQLQQIAALNAASESDADCDVQ